jgi:hypothetical protein
MRCIQNTYFSVLINESPSRLFKPSRGLRRDCPLSPFPFLIIMEALIKLLKEARSNNSFKFIKVTERDMVSHLLFVDDVFFSVQGTCRELTVLKKFWIYFVKLLEWK